MDPKIFYGKNKIVLPEIPDGNISEVDNLSDDDCPQQPTVLVEESDYDSDDEIDKIRHVTADEDIISETDEESDVDDNIPLIHLIQKNKKQKVTPNTPFWELKNLSVSENDTKFVGDDNLPPEIRELETPYNFFKFFFTNEILDEIVVQSNLYSVQTNLTKPLSLSKTELQKFIGTCIFMSVVQLPATRHYWSSYMGHPVVSNIMTCNRWEAVKRSLHFNDNSNYIPLGQAGHDKLFKLRPLLTSLGERLLLVPKEEYLAVDEQIIPTKARSSLKQYNPKKPHKWGYKAFVLSGISGFSYDYEIFAGEQNNTVPAGAPNLGVSSNVVVRMAKTIQRHKNHKLFFDNWFTSVPLQIYLTKEGILPLGTVRLNRVPNAQMPTEKEMRRQGRGSIIEKVATIEGIDLSLVSWYDNKIVTVMSTYVGSNPTIEVSRFSRKDKKHVTVQCPQAIKVYNNYMGGVDLLDSMLGYYRIQIRSKKWYLRIFFHLIDLYCVNAWILWRRKNTDDDDYLPLVDFKLAIAEALCSIHTTIPRKRGRRGQPIENLLEEKKKRQPATEVPLVEVLLDGVDHLPIWEETRQRCKYPGCTGKSFIKCQKCQIHLCLNKERNCFYKVHTA